ncbi:flagellin [Arsukibacterium perlucidum]|uniref:flagellin N-terminal helical domain-containing protein n=1 Tax=Arsukibacterium perlucidum TaxID=368811 RepID=UPI00036A4244|nr:flagellin [Arsukibacterium perlucidum]
MALYVNSNISALNAQRQLMNSGNALDTSFKRLSSGLRINSAADDAAGLQISDRLESQIQGLGQGNRNANDGISLAQTAEGAMEEMTAMLQRVRTLSQQSANGSNTGEDRLAIQEEIRSLMGEINRVARDTTFGGQNLLDGSYAASFQVGADAVQTIGFSMRQVGGSAGDTLNSLTANGGFTLSGMAGIASAVVSNALTAILGAAGVSGLSAINSDITLADIAFSAASLQATAISVSTQQNAQLVMASIDSLIAVVDKKRAELGAVQNRFQATIRNQTNIAENLSGAKSRIKDADFAAETAMLTRNQILQQATTTILAQANQRPQSALSLLQG